MFSAVHIQKGGARCRTNTSDLNGHRGPVNESQGGLGEQRAGVFSSLKQRCWNRQRQQNTAKGHNRPSTNSSQRQCDRNLHKRNAVFSSRSPVRLSAGLSLSLPHTSIFTLWFTLSAFPCQQHAASQFNVSTGGLQDQLWYLRTEGASGFLSCTNVVCRRFETWGIFNGETTRQETHFLVR